MTGFTVVVPTRSRPERLAACLEALAAQAYPRDRLQVVIVDDGSDESMRPVVEPYSDRLDVELIERENEGPGAARNVGAARARYPWLAFTDDDCAPDPGWLRALAAAVPGQPDAMLGGPIVNALPDNPYAEASQQLVSYLYEYYNETDGTGRFLTSNNMAMPTAGFDAIGGFSASFPLAAAEDRDLCQRWTAAGRRIGYVPAAEVSHFHDLNLGTFWRQHLGYGRGAHRYHKLRAARGEGRLRVEPLRFYARLLRYPLGDGVGPMQLRTSALLIASQVANAAGFFTEAYRARKS